MVSTLTTDDVPAVVAVLSEAFHEYPVMRFVLRDGREYDEHLRTLITFFVMARMLREEPILGVSEGDDLAAAALVSRPGSGPSPLSTEVESNVPLYRRFGYRVLGSAPVASAFTTWAMFREADPT